MCFVKKHQGVAILLNKHILSKCVINALYVLCLIFPFFICACLNSLSLSRENALIYIKEVYPQGYIQFSNLPNFVVYVKSQNTIIFIVALFLVASFGFLFLCLSIYDIVRMMSHLKLRISKLTYEKHNEALRSVIIQFITAVLCMAGPMIQVLILVFEIPQMNFISELIFAWFASHSSINMVSLFIFFPPYRKIIAKGLKNITHSCFLVFVVVVSLYIYIYIYISLTIYKARVLLFLCRLISDQSNEILGNLMLNAQQTSIEVRDRHRISNVFSQKSRGPRRRCGPRLVYIYMITCSPLKSFDILFCLVFKM
nr:hypothetical protein D2062.10 - Caenorhabditis elegans [Caenorhabditis elegans]